MREEIETKKSLAQLKSFIVREMKSQSADWMETKIGHNYVKDEEGFKSEYLKILREVKSNNDPEQKPYRIYLCDGGSGHGEEYRYDLKDIGFSNIRFYFLLNKVKRFSKRREEMQKKEMLAYRWETFLGKNKVLNRDRKIDEILK